jgi:hypothetical protein
MIERPHAQRRKALRDAATVWISPVWHAFGAAGTRTSDIWILNPHPKASTDVVVRFFSYTGVVHDQIDRTVSAHSTEIFTPNLEGDPAKGGGWVRIDSKLPVVPSGTRRWGLNGVEYVHMDFYRHEPLGGGIQFGPIQIQTSWFTGIAELFRRRETQDDGG